MRQTLTIAVLTVVLASLPPRRRDCHFFAALDLAARNGARADHVLERGRVKPTIIVRDRDKKFTEQFCAVVENDGIAFEPIPPRSPNLNPFAERWVQSVKRECLDHFIVFGEAHLRYLIENYLAYYNKDRPHQGLGNLRIGATKTTETEEVTTADLVCHERLSGLLRHYERKAA